LPSRIDLRQNLWTPYLAPQPDSSIGVARWNHGLRNLMNPKEGQMKGKGLGGKVKAREATFSSAC
jgi:hypothetical protein